MKIRIPWTDVVISTDTSAPRAAASDGGTEITTPEELEGFLRSGNATASGASVNPDSSMRVAAVFRCVTLIAGAVATMPLQLKRRVSDRETATASDEVEALLFRNRPNRWMTPSAFKRMMQAHVLLRGNAYALKVFDHRQRVVGLLPIHPDRVKPRQRKDLAIEYVYTRPSGGTVVLKQDEVFHLLGLTFDGVEGVSVIKYAREAVGLAMQTERHGAAVFKNGASVGAVLRAKGKLGKEAQDNLRSSLDAYRGADNAAKALILEEDMDFKPLGMTQEDAQYIETRKFSRSEIFMFFGVPPHMGGDTEKSTSWGTGIEQQSLGFVAYTLEDWLTTWEETSNRDLIGAASFFYRFNRAALVRGDINTRYQAYNIGRNGGWLSVNDIRAWEDMNPIEGGDEYLQPLNMQPVGATSNEPS